LVRVSLPTFYNFAQGKLKTLRAGADTIVWLCILKAAQITFGAMYFDREIISLNLASAGTEYNSQQASQLFKSILTLCDVNRQQRSVSQELKMCELSVIVNRIIGSCPMKFSAINKPPMFSNVALIWY
jgi:hypothetical protein